MTLPRPTLFVFPAIALVFLILPARAVEIEPPAQVDLVRVLIKEREKSIEIVENGATRVVTWLSPLPLRCISRETTIVVAGRTYRGEIVVSRRPGERTVRAINELSLEDYLRGVVPSEMPATWPPEALKAQAVAARTYAVHAALRNRARARSEFDLNATVMDQVYLGASVETKATDSAVLATAGRVLTHVGEPIRAYFHSSCGGITERPENVWGPATASEYQFRHVQDSWCATNPYHAWSTAIPFRELRGKIASGVALREILAIASGETNASGRIASFTVEGELRTRRIATTSLSGQSLRMLLGPSRVRSLRLAMTQDGDTVTFTGSGWGHGVGLCQWGARGMAAAGLGYREILAHYYPDAKLEGDPVGEDEIPTVIYPHSNNYSITNISITP